MSRTIERARQQHTYSLDFETVFLGVFFVTFSALAFLFPLSGDDWAWGSEIGEARLANLFANYNGRYAGDLAVLFLTRASILIPFVVAATVTLTIFLLVDLTDNRTKLGYLVVSLLFLGMPQGIWRQSIAWVSGFANYALGALCVLVYLRAVKSEWSASPRSSVGVGRYVAVLLFGFTSQLFMEHVTSYLVLASLVSLVLYRVRFQSFSRLGICWVVSFLAGAAFMFSNGAYRKAATADAQYQQIQTAGDGPAVKSIVHKLIDDISAFTVAQNMLVNLTIVLLVCLLLSSAANTLDRTRKLVIFGLATVFLALAYLPRDPVAYRTMSSAFGGIAGVTAGLLLVMLCLVAHFVIQDKRRRIQLYAACASVLALIAPLMLVEPIGPRCFYPTYMFFLLIVSLLLAELGERATPRTSSRVAPFLVAGVVTLFASQFAIYATINKAADERLAHVRTEVNQGSKIVNVKKLPFNSYVHVPDPVGIWGHRYKLFYDLPEQLKINVLASRDR